MQLVGNGRVDTRQHLGEPAEAGPDDRAQGLGAPLRSIFGGLEPPHGSREESSPVNGMNLPGGSTLASSEPERVSVRMDQ